MKKCIFVMCLTLTGTIHCYFEKYRAQKAYKQGNCKQAQYLLDEMLTQEPDNPEVAYNLGKVALKEKEFNKAAAYFNSATQSASASKPLQEQAWYDLGLSLVHLKQWEEALASFQEVLKINSKNEFAQKMIDQIKKILDQKKQQENEQKQDQQQDQKDDTKSDQKEKDNQKNNSDKNDQKDQNNDQGDDPEKDDQHKGDSSENKKQDDLSKREENNNEKDDEENKSNQDSQQGDEQKKEQKPDGNENHQDGKHNDEENQNDLNDRSNDQSQNQQSDSKQQNARQHDQGQSSQDHPEEALQEAKNDGKNDTQVQQKPADKETMLLQLAEKQDAQMSKALFKRQIQQQMPSRHGQKNW